MFKKAQNKQYMSEIEHFYSFCLIILFMPLYHEERIEELQENGVSVLNADKKAVEETSELEKNSISVSKVVETFVNQKPFVRECLKKDLINFSQLARLIIFEKNLSENSFDAVLIACRRQFEKLKLGKEFESKIFDLLKNSKIEIKNKICVVVFSNKIPISALTDLVNEFSKKNELFHLIQGSSAITIIFSEEFLEKIKISFKGFIVSEQKNLVEIIVKTEKEIEETPGVLAFLFGRISEFGINIIETVSSWTDTIFVIEEKDLAKTMQALKF